MGFFSESFPSFDLVRLWAYNRNQIQVLVLFIQLKSRITAAWKLVRPCPVASIMVEMRIAKAMARIPIDWSFTPFISSAEMLPSQRCAMTGAKHKRFCT
jgi:hypothetical protein